MNRYPRIRLVLAAVALAMAAVLVLARTSAPDSERAFTGDSQPPDATVSAESPTPSRPLPDSLAASRGSTVQPIRFGAPIGYPRGWVLAVLAGRCGPCDAPPDELLRVYEHAGEVRADALLGALSLVSSTKAIVEPNVRFGRDRIVVTVCSAATTVVFSDCPRQDLYESRDGGASYRWVSQADVWGRYQADVDIGSSMSPDVASGTWDRTGVLRAASGEVLADVSAIRTSNSLSLVLALKRGDRIALVWRDDAVAHVTSPRPTFVSVSVQGRLVRTWSLEPNDTEGNFYVWGWLDDRRLIGTYRPHFKPGYNVPTRPAVLDLEDGTVAVIESVGTAVPAHLPQIKLLGAVEVTP